MDFDIKIEGIEELKAAWAAGCDQLAKELAHGATRAGQTAATQIRNDAPEASGTLRRSVRARVRATKNGASGSVDIRADHASFVKDGTSPHDIFPSAARALAFEVGGAKVFAHRVRHPGTKPNDFVTAGTQQGQQVLDHDAEAAAARLKARIEG